jgi:DNA polymerase
MQSDLFGEQKPYESLDQLVTDMRAMTDDPLYPMGTNLVIFRGNPDAKLAIVGEAPGPQENVEGVPFVGRAGKLLDQILDAVNLDSEKDVFITNAVFRMPPGADGKTFRRPTSEEIAFYKPFILEIIRVVDPKIMLLTGNVSCEAFLGITGITRLRGQWRDWNGRQVMPIFHPAYLLRNPSRTPGSPKANMWEDIQEVRRVYDELGLGA